MTYEKFTSDLPRDGTVTFSSCEENEETMQGLGVKQQVLQLGRGSFQCKMAVAEIGDTALFSDRFSKACSLYLEPPEGMIGFLFPVSATGKFRANGEDVADEQLVVFPEGTETDLVLPDLAGSNAIFIPAEHFEELVDLLCPPPGSVAPQSIATIAGDTARLHTLSHALNRLVADPGSDGESLSNFVAALLGWMGDAVNRRGPERFEGNGDHRRHAKKAQEYIEATYRDPIRVEDLCGTCGVGLRTLQRSFRKYFDLTITEYVQALRFDAARRKLHVSHPAESSVTNIALSQGHPHLGRFSVEFRERFGESPSETLARSARRGLSSHQSLEFP